MLHAKCLYKVVWKMYVLGPAEVFDMQRDRVQLQGPNVSAHQVTVVTVRYVNMQSCCIIKAFAQGT